MALIVLTCRSQFRSAFLCSIEDTLFCKRLTCRYHTYTSSICQPNLNKNCNLSLCYDYFASFRETCHIWSWAPFRLPFLITFPHKENLYQVNKNTRPRFRLITDISLLYKLMMVIVAASQLIRVLCSRSSGPIRGKGHCVIFSGKTLDPHIALLSTQCRNGHQQIQ